MVSTARVPDNALSEQYGDVQIPFLFGFPLPSFLQTFLLFAHGVSLQTKNKEQRLRCHINEGLEHAAL